VSAHHSAGPYKFFWILSKAQSQDLQALQVILVVTSSCSHRWPCSLYGNTWTKFKSKCGWLCQRYVCWIL